MHKAIGTYCHNADLGHADAQMHIGDILYQGAYGRKADIVGAWVWNSLAAQNGDEVV
jgi:TPR repeat protein